MFFVYATDPMGVFATLGVRLQCGGEYANLLHVATSSFVLWLYGYSHTTMFSHLHTYVFILRLPAFSIQLEKSGTMPVVQLALLLLLFAGLPFEFTKR